MARSGDGQQEPRQSGQRRTRWGFLDFASAVWGVALTVFAIGAALQVAKSFPDPGPARRLCDLGMIAAPLVGLAVTAYLFSIRERRRALTTVLVMSALFALVLNGTDLIAWRWVRARAEVPDGLGAIVLSTRSLNPPSLLSMPWNDHMAMHTGWQSTWGRSSRLDAHERNALLWLSIEHCSNLEAGLPQQIKPRLGRKQPQHVAVGFDLQPPGTAD